MLWQRYVSQVVSRVFLARFSPLYAVNPTIKPYGILENHGGHGIAAAILAIRPWNRCGHFGHAVMELLLTMAAMDSLQPFWLCSNSSLIS